MLNNNLVVVESLAVESNLEKEIKFELENAGLPVLDEAVVLTYNIMSNLFKGGLKDMEKMSKSDNKEFWKKYILTKLSVFKTELSVKLKHVYFYDSFNLWDKVDIFVNYYSEIITRKTSEEVLKITSH